MEKPRLSQIAKSFSGPLAMPPRIPDEVRRFPGQGRLKRYREANSKLIAQHMKYGFIHSLFALSLVLMNYPESNPVNTIDFIRIGIALVPAVLGSIHAIELTRANVNE
ncbi:MAG TPA: hypothetical protein VN711_00990, partial [Candidatus Saccharimonadales bacterium]|nr:hypothetical protein [Candidatus Saccharimonadales bacterium]